MHDTRQKIALLFLLLSLPQTAVGSWWSIQSAGGSASKQSITVQSKIQDGEKIVDYVGQAYTFLHDTYGNVKDDILKALVPVYTIGVIDLAYGSISNFMRSKITVEKMNRMYDWHKPELYDVEKIHAGLDALNRLNIDERYFNLPNSYYEVISEASQDFLQKYTEALKDIFKHVPEYLLRVYVIEVLKSKKSGQPGIFSKYKVWTPMNVAQYDPQWPDTVNSDGDYVGDPTTVQKIYACMQGIESIWAEYESEVEQAVSEYRKFILTASQADQVEVMPAPDAGAQKLVIAAAGGGQSSGLLSRSRSSSPVSPKQKAKLSAAADNLAREEMQASHIAAAGGGQSSRSSSRSRSSSPGGSKLRLKAAGGSAGSSRAQVLQDDFSPITYEDLQRAEADLTAKFPFTANLANKPSSITLTKNGQPAQDRQRLMIEQAKSVYPLLDSKVLELIENFLAVKRRYGTDAEKALYSGMSVGDFITRLLTKRPYVFIGPDGAFNDDQFVLRGTESLQRLMPSGYGFVDLSEYLSYDEIAISALVSVAVPTFFVNAGNRGNNGRQGEEGSYQNQGVVVGAVGARFEKPGYMEFAHMIITQEQNTPAHGYGNSSAVGYIENPLLQVWADFYEIPYFPSYDEVVALQDSGKVSKLDNEKGKGCDFIEKKVAGKAIYLNAQVYKKRMKKVVVPYLLAANEYGRMYGKRAYCRVVGLGIGVWEKFGAQRYILADVYRKSLEELKLPYIANLEMYGFGFFNDSLYDISVPSMARNQIKVCATNFENLIEDTFQEIPNDPYEPLRGDNADKLLVAQYAWDGNSYPGNEYWFNRLVNSGDPAAACASSITYLQNPDVNPEFTTRAAICSADGGGLVEVIKLRS